MGGGPYYAQLGGARILNAGRVDQSGSDDVDVTDWSKADAFILAVCIHSGGKDTEAAQYKVRFRDATDDPGGSFVDVDSTGEVKFGSTDLVNGASISESGRKCSSQGDTWQAGEEVEGTKLSDSIDLADDCETEIHFSLTCADGDNSHKYEFELYDGTRGASLGQIGCALTLNSGLSKVNSDLTAVFDIFFTVQSDSTLLFDIKNTVNSDLTALFGVLNTVNSDSTLVYDMRGLVQSDISMVYDMFGKIQSDSQMVFDILNSIQSGLVMLFDITNLVQSDLTVLYDMAARVNSDLVVVYDMSGKVNSDLAMWFDIRNTVNSDLSALFDVLNTVNSESVLIYDVLGLVQSDFTGIYDVFGKVQSDLEMIYDIFGTSPEGPPIQIMLKHLIASRRRNTNYARSNNRI